MLASKTAMMASWMARTFQPVRIKIPLINALVKKHKITHNNQLFSFLLDIDLNDNTRIQFMDNRNTLHYKMMRKYIHPQGIANKKFDIDLSKNCDYLVFSTNGLVPARWAQMAVDFTPLANMDTSIESYSENELIEFEQRILLNLKRVGDIDKIFEALYHKVYDTDLKLKFQVIKSPDYSLSKIDELDKRVLSVLPQCYTMTNKEIKEQLISRNWLCYKNHYSIPTSIFMSRSINYRSLQYFNLRDMNWIPSAYGTIMDTAAYFPMHCIMHQPWYQFVRAWDSSRLKIPSCGNEDTYENNETVNYEEMVVLKEILLAEGAVIKEILD